MVIPFFQSLRPETSESFLTQYGTPIVQATCNSTLERIVKSYLRIYKELVIVDGRKRFVKDPNKILTFCYSPKLLERCGFSVMLSS